MNSLKVQFCTISSKGVVHERVKLVWGTKEKYINIHNQCIEHTKNSHFPQIVLFEVGNSE